MWNQIAIVAFYLATGLSLIIAIFHKEQEVRIEYTLKGILFALLSIIQYIIKYGG